MAPSHYTRPPRETSASRELGTSREGVRLPDG